MQMDIKHTSRSVIFSERDYVTFAICRLSVTLVRPTQPVEIFRSFFTIRYLGHPLTSTENFTEIVPGEPLRRVFKRKGDSDYSYFWHLECENSETMLDRS